METKPRKQTKQELKLELATLRSRVNELSTALCNAQSIISERGIRIRRLEGDAADLTQEADARLEKSRRLRAIAETLVFMSCSTHGPDDFMKVFRNAAQTLDHDPEKLDPTAKEIFTAGYVDRIRKTRAHPTAAATSS